MSVKMNCKESATKRCRTRFNLWQIRKLEKVFHETHYPDTQQMEVLASETSISMSKMQIWFQNRRAKWRKNSRLKNFGGLASVRETAYVPAPHMADTLGSLTFDHTLKHLKQNDIQIKSEENNAIDLRIRSLESDCDLSSHPMFDSNVYKKCAAITRVRLNDPMNAFEYPAAYYSRHYMDNRDDRDMDNRETPVLPFILASNQRMTSLLFAPNMYSVCIQSTNKCDLNLQNTDFNK